LKRSRSRRKIGRWFTVAAALLLLGLPGLASLVRAGLLAAQDRGLAGNSIPGVVTGGLPPLLFALYAILLLSLVAFVAGNGLIIWTLVRFTKFGQHNAP
jgi:hypothetical protein